MKKLRILSILSILLTAQYIIGQPIVKDAYPRLNLSRDESQKILNIAKHLCSTFAPDYNIAELTPIITEFRELTKHDRKAFPPAYADRKLAIVYFMSDTTNCSYSKFTYHNEKTGENEILRKPIAKINTIICLDNLEPVGIFGDLYGTLFTPDYETFCKEHPDYRVPKNASENIGEITNVNEAAKKELENKGYKNVKIGK